MIFGIFNFLQSYVSHANLANSSLFIPNIYAIIPGFCGPVFVPVSDREVYKCCVESMLIVCHFQQCV